MKRNINWKNVIGLGGMLLMVLFAIGMNVHVTRATADDEPFSVQSVAVNTDSKINYQGYLEIDGTPDNATRTMAFNFYELDTCASAVLDTHSQSVLVTDGMFSVDIPVDHSVFDGSQRYIEVVISGTSMTCDQIIATPYALSLRPGAQIVGEPASSTGYILNAELEGYYPFATAFRADAATGYAMFGVSPDGIGLYANTDNGMGIKAYDGGSLLNRGFAGHFTSSNGVGLHAASWNTSHYGHAGEFYANYGNGVYAESSNNASIVGNNTDHYGVQGNSTNSTGVYGQSTNGRGVYGYSYNGNGVYGTSSKDYGVFATSNDYRGLYARSTSTYYAAYIENTNGNSYAGLGVVGTTNLTGNTTVNGSLTVTGSKSGYVVDIVQNAGDTPLETGDVVILVGGGEALLGDIPLLLVALTNEQADSAVIGVIDQPYALPEHALAEGDGETTVTASAEIAYADEGTAVQPGGYASMVTLGAFKAIKVDASYGAIQPGDILVTSPNPGYAMRTDDPGYGSIIGKAVGSLESGTGVIAVMVTLD